MVEVSILIINYNGKKYLDNCLKSVYKQNYKDFEVIILDNNSSDDSVDFVKSNFPKVKIIEHKDNIGFAAGNNLAAKYAKGDYILLLSQDTIVQPNMLKELLKSSKKYDAACQPKILLMQHRDRLNLVNLDTNYLGFSWVIDYNKPDRELKEQQISFATGAILLINKNLFKKIGGFDENYFMYHEDVDLSWRLGLIGKKIYLVPKAVGYHDYTFTKTSAFKFFHLERNRLFTLFKNYKIKTMILLFPIFIFVEFGVILFSLTNGLFFQKIKSWLSFIKNIRKVMQKRKKVNKFRTLSDKEIKDMFSSTIEFEGTKGFVVDKILNPILKFYWSIVKHLI